MTESHSRDRVGFEFDALRAALQTLASRAEAQLARYPDFVCKADELMLDFDDALLLVRHNRPHELAEHELAALLAVDEHLTLITQGASHLGTELGVRVAPEWAELRLLAGNALAALGWPHEPPPPNRATYVRG